MKKLLSFILGSVMLFQCSERDLVAPQVSTDANLAAIETTTQSLVTAAFNVYVNPAGSDAGAGTLASPWKTLRHAVSKVPANQGYAINLSAGTFVETGLIEVPLGVSIGGAGIDKTILKAASSFYYHPTSPSYSTDKFLISLNEYNQLNGNQTLSGFTIDGDAKKLHGGIYVRHRNNVVIDNVKVINTNFTGIWLWDLKDSKLLNTQIINSSWGSSAYCVGALNLGNLERVEIAGLNINESTGYGIKAIGPNGGNNIIGVKIHDSRISVHPRGLWNNGSAPNIAIELWQVNLVGNEIYNTYVDNTISLINSNAIPSTGVQTIRVHHNQIDLETRAQGAGYGLELTIHDAEVDHNYFLKGTYGIANWDNPMKNWNIHHNTFYAIQGTYPGEIVRSQWSGLHNVKLYNNTIEFTGTRTMNVVGMYGGSSENIDLKNNLIINNNISYSYYPNELIHLENGASVSSLTVKNNSLFKLPVGSVGGSYQGNLTNDPLILATGNRPDSYYSLKAGSSLINAGVNVGFPYAGTAPDIGAIESGVLTTNIQPIVSITSPANNSTFTAGTTIKINANATDADGTISKVEFYAGSTLLGQDITAPYTLSWSGAATGTYQLTVKATDNANNSTTSGAISIAITAVNTLPTVSLTSPSPNSTYATGSTVTLTANAADTNGSIQKVEFFSGTTKLGEDLSSPYSLTWSATAGAQLLSARATDNQGAVANSTPVGITVTNGTGTVRLFLDSSNAILTGNIKSGFDNQAQNSNFFYVEPGAGKNYYIPPPGAALFTLQVPKTDSYVIWVRVLSPTSANQSFHIYNGQGKWFTWSAGVNPVWNWVKITENGKDALFPFTTGSNQFHFGWLDENVKVDQVIVTNDFSFKP